MIRVLHVPVGDQPTIKEIDGSLKSMQSLVGGHLEGLGITEDIAMYLHGEGKGIGLPQNFLLMNKAQIVDVAVGDVFFCSHNEEGDAVSLTDEMIQEIVNRFIDRGAFKVRK